MTAQNDKNMKKAQLHQVKRGTNEGKHTFQLHQISSEYSPLNDPLADFLPKQ